MSIYKTCRKSKMLNFFVVSPQAQLTKEVLRQDPTESRNVNVNFNCFNLFVTPSPPDKPSRTNLMLYIHIYNTQQKKRKKKRTELKWRQKTVEWLSVGSILWPICPRRDWHSTRGSLRPKGFHGGERNRPYLEHNERNGLITVAIPYSLLNSRRTETNIYKLVLPKWALVKNIVENRGKKCNGMFDEKCVRFTINPLPWSRATDHYTRAGLPKREEFLIWGHATGEWRC